VSVKLGTQNHPSLLDCFSGMPLISVPSYLGGQNVLKIFEMDSGSLYGGGSPSSPLRWICHWTSVREYYVDEGKLIVVDVCGRVCWPVRASAPCTRVYRPILMIVPGVAILNGAVRLTSLAAGCGLNRRYLRRAVTFPLPPKHYNYLL